MSGIHVLRQEFIDQTKDVTRSSNHKALVVAVQLPSTGVEVITNCYQIYDKVQYYLTAYDDEFRLKAYPSIKIIGFMLV